MQSMSPAGFVSLPLVRAVLLAQLLMPRFAWVAIQHGWAAVVASLVDEVSTDSHRWVGWVRVKGSSSHMHPTPGVGPIRAA